MSAFESNRLNIHINVIGLGVSEKAELSSNSLKALRRSEMVIGWNRHRKIICPLLMPEQIFFEVKKLTEIQTVLNSIDVNAAHKKDCQTMETINNENGETDQIVAFKVVTIVASGDPLYFGIGDWLSKNLPSRQLYFFPAVSSIQSACHKQGISLQHATVISLHGRPLESLKTKLKKNQTLIILTDQNSQPSILARECIAAGFDRSIITVHENLGYNNEMSESFEVSTLRDLTKTFNPLHVSIIEVKGEGGVLPEFPGIPDHHFETGTESGKGMLSKREVRLSILSMIQPSQGDVIWDIGAGCGGVAVELACWNDKATIYAIEYHNNRLNHLRTNRKKFGVVENLFIVEGKALSVLDNLPRPNKIFIGGSGGLMKTFLTDLWECLPINGVLVASGVLDETKNQLRIFAETLMSHQVESVEVSIRRGQLVDNKVKYVSKLPVEIYKFSKATMDETVNQIVSVANASNVGSHDGIGE